MWGIIKSSYNSIFFQESFLFVETISSSPDWPWSPGVANSPVGLELPSSYIPRLTACASTPGSVFYEIRIYYVWGAFLSNAIGTAELRSTLSWPSFIQSSESPPTPSLVCLLPPLKFLQWHRKLNQRWFSVTREPYLALERAPVLRPAGGLGPSSCCVPGVLRHLLSSAGHRARTGPHSCRSPLQMLLTRNSSMINLHTEARDSQPCPQRENIIPSSRQIDTLGEMWRRVWEILIINFVREKSQGIRYFPTVIFPLGWT